jgi:hypothetical protein
LYNRVRIFSIVFWDLAVLGIVVFAIQRNFLSAISMIETVPNKRQPNPRLRRSYSFTFFTALFYWILSLSMLQRVA